MSRAKLRSCNGSKTRNAELERGALYGAALQAMAAPGRTIRLRHRAGALGALRNDAKARHGKSARAKKERLHASAVSFSSSLTAGRKFFARSM